MFGSHRHDEIRRWMERAAAGQDNAGQRLRFDPGTGRFEVVSDEDSATDDLPSIGPEDLKSFAGAGIRVR